MKINHNMSAVIAHNQLIRNEDGLSRSIQRLSSGLKINKAADDVAGMAISTKMHAQIEGLDQASQNALDGISVIETADGALQEVTEMIKRMRELSVQAANDTNTLEDRQAIQAEIDSLTEEIDRVSRDTEFNTKKLLNGDLDQRVYTNTRSITNIDISDAVDADKYKVSVTQDARQAVISGNAAAAAGGNIPAGTITINGSSVTITEGQDIQSVYEELRKAAELGGVNVFAVESFDNTAGKPENAGYEPSEFTPGKPLVFVSEEYGSATEMKITCNNNKLANYLGISTEVVVRGTDAQITLDEGFTSQASYTTDGNKIVITDRNGFEMSFEAEPGLAGTSFVDVTYATSTPDAVNQANGATAPGGTEVLLDVTEIGMLTLQIGANEDQIMDVRIPEVSAAMLYIDNINVCKVDGATKAIGAYDVALTKVNEVRARLGAYQNRLESTTSSLNIAEEKMTAALSRIEDADMAEEMTRYTQYTVLTQAATSVLAQANEIPQQALQLLS